MHWKRLICSQDSLQTNKWMRQPDPDDLIFCLRRFGMWATSETTSCSSVSFHSAHHPHLAIQCPERHARSAENRHWHDGKDCWQFALLPPVPQSCSDTENHLLQMPCKLHCAPCGHVCATDWVLRWASFCLHGEDNWYSDKSVFRPLQEILNHRLNIKLLESNRVSGENRVIAWISFPFHLYKWPNVYVQQDLSHQCHMKGCREQVSAATLAANVSMFRTALKLTRLMFKSWLCNTLV